MAGLIDTHLHLYRGEFDDDRDGARTRAHSAGVSAFVHVGYDAATNEQAQTIAKDDPVSWATAGLHPHEATAYDETLESWIVDHADSIVAVGECGLDYYRDLSPRDAQHEAFRRQIALADRLEKPMIFHVRDAYPDARAILIESGLPSRRGIFHAFAGDRDFARWAVNEGFKLGIGGVFTYRNAHLPEAVEGLPGDAMQLETDAPWLPPQPWRGKRNEPAYARHTAELVATSLDTDVDTVAEIWAREFERLFDVRLPGAFWDERPSRCPAPERRRKS